MPSTDPTGARTTDHPPPPGAPEARPARVRLPALRTWKERGAKWAMLTCYDVLTAEVFDDAGIPVLLVGDSAANTVYGHDSTLPVTVDELLPLVRAVVRGARRALVVADLPFGSYAVDPAQAVATGVRFLKEGGAHAVKLEGGAAFAPHVTALVTAGVPVMGHLGFTPQHEHALGGYRVQGRGAAGDRLVADALALQDAGAFAVVLEMVPAALAARVTRELAVPTVGIGAGGDTDAQVLVWTDMAGLGRGRAPRFVKRYADVGAVLHDAAQRFAAEVRDGHYPAEAHTYD